MAQHRTMSTRRPSQQQQNQHRQHPPPSTSLQRRAQKSSRRLSSRPTAALSSASKEAASIMRRSNRPLRRTAASSLVSSLAARSVLALASVLLVLASISSASAAADSVSSTDALFDALDSDHDGMISRRDFDSSVATIAGALGVEIGTAGGGGGDDAAGDDEGESAGGAGGEEEGGDDGLVQMIPGGGDANTAASDVQNRNAQAARRDGLTGEIRPGGRAFNPGRAAKPKKAKAGNKDKPKKLSFTKAFASSVAMILATEIGDKTFFIAAVLSMRNDRLAVFGGAILALIVMTILSTMMGLVLPSILPRRYTHIIGGLLFLYFGIKLVLDSRTMEDKVSDELEEVEEELGVQGAGGGAASKKDEEEDVSEYGTDTDVENGTGTGARKRRSKHESSSSAPKRTTSGLAGATAYSSTNVQKIFLQALTLTFLAEWGDRSQIATIALAAAKDPLGVTVGGCVGHSMCTGMAVVGGRMLASRISERTVSFWGGIIFNVFGVHSLFFER